MNEEPNTNAKQPNPPTPQTLVEIPGNWYAEDATPMQYYPHTPNSQGYVDVRLMERMWHDKFTYILSERADMADNDMMVFPLVLHPDTSGMAHVIGMIERVVGWLQGWGEGVVEFETFEECARGWRGMNNIQ